MKRETPESQKQQLAEEQLAEAKEMLGEKKVAQHPEDRPVTFEQLQAENELYMKLVAKHSEEVTAAAKELMNTVQSLGAQEDGEWAVARAVDSLKKFLPRLGNEKFAGTLAKKVRKDMIAELEAKQVALLNDLQLSKEDEQFADDLGKTVEALKKGADGAERAA